MCIHCEKVICSRIVSECLLYFVMCIHCDAVICSRILYECLLYSSCVRTVIQLYAAELCVSVYYIFHVYSL